MSSAHAVKADLSDANVRMGGAAVCTDDAAPPMRTLASERSALTACALLIA